ncbi:uncharacterized protein Rcd2 [Drosophila tropicalis]|uniref:uncharacterized protein Rcd2 n=1 Tax=Drosophila tropicalis TaxID=46794 RepID=UPI0035AC21B9
MAANNIIVSFFLLFCITVRQINSASIFPKDISPIYLNCDSIKCPDSDKCPTDSFHPPIHEFNEQQNCCLQKSCTCKECPGPSAEDFLKCGKDGVLLVQKQGNGTPGNCCDQYKCGKKPICVDRSKSVKYYPKKCIKCNSCVMPCELVEACEEEIGHCLSDTMEGKRNGSKWTEQNGCLLCRCVNAKKKCSGSQCQPNNCENPKRIEGQCCPVCPEDLDPLPIDIYTEAFEKPTMKPIEAMTTTPSAPTTSGKSIIFTMSTTIQQQEQQQQLDTISTTPNAPIESAISKDLHKTEKTIVYLPTDAVPILIIDEKDEIPTTKIDVDESSTTEESNDTTDAILIEESSSYTVGPSTANDIPTEMLEKESENIFDDISIDSFEETISPSATSFPFLPSSSSTEEEGMIDFGSTSTTDGPSTISSSISMPMSTSSPDLPTPESTSQHKDLVTMDRTSRTVEENPCNDTISHNVAKSKASDHDIINHIIVASLVVILIVFGIIGYITYRCVKKSQIEKPEMSEKPDKQKQKKMENRIYTPVPSEHNLSQITETSSLCFPQCGVESDKV